MHILPKIAVCSLVALMPAAVHVHSARAAERVETAGVAANSVLLGGQHTLAANRDTAREQVHVWRNVSADDAVIREVTMERHLRPAPTVQDNQLARTELLAAPLPTVTPLQVDGESVKELAGLSRTDELWQTKLAGTAAVAQPLQDGGVLDEWDEQSRTPVRSAGVPLLAKGLSGIHGLIALAVILITAFRKEICRALNQAIFLWTAQPHGVPVVASGYQRRRRRRSSRWTWKSGRRGSNWSPGLRPSRRRSRRRSHSRRRTATRSHSNDSAAPRYRRGGREYVVADVVFTHSGSIYGFVTPPAGGLLTFSND
jgi:hypothetical protein